MGTGLLLVLVVLLAAAVAALWLKVFRLASRLDAGAPAGPEPPAPPVSPGVAADGQAPEPGTVTAPPPSPDPEPTPPPAAEEAFVLPGTPRWYVPVSMVAAAGVALHLFDGRRLPLGKTVRVHADGIPRTVTLLAVGTLNRARVDGEEVVFARSLVAPDEAGSR
ncbi:MAG: hypothetical protein FJ098_12740 [Deltaproteobacteria bacterium]|nr:hypothetical protein [Deltaproteobacteria bacterium]